MANFLKNPERFALFEHFHSHIEKFSPYLTALTRLNGDVLDEAGRNGCDRTFKRLLRQGTEALYAETDGEAVSKGLRNLKKRAALLAAVADIEGVWSTERLMRALSALAEVCVRIAVSFVLRRAAQRGEIALSDSLNPEKGCGFFILAMGKLGGRELNYSSDIDLIALFDAQKVSCTGKRDAGSLFVRMTKEIIALLEERTADGYVFRTDLRLRPDPGSTPVAVSTTAAEYYYESFAQNWERAAFIKARPVAGDKEAARVFLKTVRPFVWRRTSDFYVLEQIRSLKYSFSSSSPDDSNLSGRNIKLGRGGIREIEFFTQLQQLLWGGRDARLRSRSTLNALDALHKAGWVSVGDRDGLRRAYLFLRKVEHRLQMESDEQTQTLPDDKADLERLALFSGFESLESFKEELLKHMECVCRAYETLFADEEGDKAERWSFGGTELPLETAERLKELGFTRLDFIADAVRGWLSGRYRAFRSERARALMESLLVPVFRALGKTGNADGAFIRFDDFLKGLPAGIQLFSLFQSRPALLDLTAQATAVSPYLSSCLMHSPDLFDAVLSPDFFAPFVDARTLGRMAQKQAENGGDLERTLDLLRRFAREQKFKCGVRFLRGTDDSAAVGKNLADLAQAALSVLCPAVKEEFEKRYGVIRKSSFAVAVMGKAGSREMNFRSDLDLLFLYDSSSDAVSSGGRTELPAGVYFARLAQRFVSALTANAKEGVLWAADMRLRPSGNAGPVAVSLEAFQRYYSSDAWTWEKMAMTKARIVWGDAPAFQKHIQAVLQQNVPEKKLRADVAEMYARVIEAHPAKSVWDVKYTDGGMVDIEFSVQFLQLRYGAGHPELLRHAVTPVLETAARKGLIGRETFTVLNSAYRLWQDLSVLFSLCLDENETPSGNTGGANEKICRLCNVSDLSEAVRKIRQTAERAASYRLF